MKFFKPEDFTTGIITADIRASDAANAKLEREGKVVFAEAHNLPWHNVSFQGQTHTALLIAIEPIEKCEHPREKLKVEYSIKYLPHRKDVVLCECGAELKLRSFDVCDD